MQPLLSDLCSVCHKHSPKYRCPACSARTCSLDCVQTHKSRASCSGKRDPTSYVKKSQLVTPSGVDHDYNFLSGVERSRDRAEEQLQGRSIQDAAGRSTRLNQPAFRSRLQLARVHIEYAPLGMSRQKLNRTKLTQSKRINWTVEWIHEDQTSTIGSIFDDEEVCKAYRPLQLKRAGTSRRKRKRDGGPSSTGKMLDPIEGRETPPVENPAPAKELFENSTLKRDHEDATGREPLITQADDRSPATTPAVDNVGQIDVIMEMTSEQDNNIGKDAGGEQPPTPLPSGSPDDLVLYYYLVKPRTSGIAKVLIPLSPADTFLTCLQNQTVLEFPSIQVLSNGPDALPTGFVTEDEYLARFKKEAHDMEKLIMEEGQIDSGPDPNAEDRNVSRSHTAQDTGSAVPNPSTLLATLERDMRG